MPRSSCDNSPDRAHTLSQISALPTSDGCQFDTARAGVSERLGARRREIDEAILARVGNVAFGHDAQQAAKCAPGLAVAVTEIVELALTVIAQGEGRDAPISDATLKQACRAAQLRVGLGTVLRCCMAGSARLEDFIMEEADRSDTAGDQSGLRQALRRTQAAFLDRISSAITHAYNSELEQIERSPEQHRAELVSRLLAAERLDSTELAKLAYPFAVWHVGVIATGPRAQQALQAIKARLGCELLSVPSSDGTRWAWLGSSRIFRATSIEVPEGVSLTAGEPRRDFAGWRLTHHEAQAALRVAAHRPPGLTRCQDVVLEAAVMQDRALSASLESSFLQPLDDLRAGGATARRTLRAYFAAKRNTTRAAKRLGVVRNTMVSRLAEIEELLGRPLHACSAQLEIALSLEALRHDTAMRYDVRPTLPPRMWTEFDSTSASRKAS